jgi:hypothetical protein
MSADMDWDNWNQKFIEKILRIVNSERVKHQGSTRVCAKGRKSQYVCPGAIKEVLAGGQPYVRSSNRIQEDKLGLFVSDG